MDMAAEGITADSIFIQNSRPIKFVVNRINISDQDREWITDVLIPELQRLGIGALFSDVPLLLPKVHTTTTVVWQTNVAHRSTLCSEATASAPTTSNTMLWLRTTTCSTP